MAGGGRVGGDGAEQNPLSRPSNNLNAATSTNTQMNAPSSNIVTHVDNITREHAASTPPSPRREPQQHHEASGTLWQPKALDPSEIDGDLEIGSMVEVENNPENCRYGVIKWIGYLRDKHKPIAGLEMVSTHCQQ